MCSQIDDKCEETFNFSTKLCGKVLEKFILMIFYTIFFPMHPLNIYKKDLLVRFHIMFNEIWWENLYEWKKKKNQHIFSSSINNFFNKKKKNSFTIFFFWKFHIVRFLFTLNLDILGWGSSSSVWYTKIDILCGGV